MHSTVTIVGQGYVGLPLAQQACESGEKVFGFDVSQRVVMGLQRGKSHIDDLGDADIQAMLDHGYVPTLDEAIISGSDTVVICVPTPLGEGNAPDLTYIESACQTVAKNLSKGSVVILESTTYPGTTEELCKPILENGSGLKAGEDFYLAFSPERVDPGNKKFGIKNTPKLVGGITTESTEKAAEFYRGFVNEVVPMSGPKEAETAKLLENTFRHVNIALVNEIAKVCHELDIDIWEVIRGASTKPFGYMPFTPGAGVGGHCIPIDPNYLSYEVRRNLGYPLKFVELAQEVNASMPKYVASRIADALNKDSKALNRAKVLILGVTYKKNIADQRESPAVPLAKILLSSGAEVKYNDPYVPTWEVGSEVLNSEADLGAAVEEADIVVLLQKHNSFDIEQIEQKAMQFLDTTGTSKIREHRL